MESLDDRSRQGIYEAGNIELLGTPAALREGRVRVLVIEEPERGPEPR
jgi:hypothetical protein